MPRSRIFAAVYDPLTAGAEKASYPEHRTFVAGGARGRVLEVGAGTGANLRYYRFAKASGVPHPNPLPAGEGNENAGEGVTELTLTDLSPHMLKRLKAKAEKLGVKAAFHETSAESLPFPDASFDTVAGTLMMCSVKDPAKALAEVRRVLVPGGEYRFIEHVRSSSRGWAAFQGAIKPIWTVIGDGCHPDRDTLRAITDAGFRLTDIRPFKVGPYPVRPHVAGVAQKP